MWWWALAIVGLIILISAAYGGYRAAIWVPMASSDAQRIAALLQLQPGQTMYDLGCGDGRMLEAAAKQGATAIGYEVSILPFLLAWWRKLRSPYGARMHVRYGDFWFASWKDADVIIVYLMESVYPKLQQKIASERTERTTVVTYVWPVSGWKEYVHDEVPGKPSVWIYEVPQTS